MLSLEGSLRGERALELLLAASVRQARDAELCVNAHMVDSVDVVAATATRMRIERHLREHPQGYVSIWLPQQSSVASRYYDILHPLPDQVGVGEVPSGQPPPLSPCSRRPLSRTARTRVC